MTSTRFPRLVVDRIRSLFPLKAEYWDRYKYVRSTLVLGLVICSVGSVGNWYNWARGNAPLYFPVVLTFGAALLFMIAPKKWELIMLCLMAFFVLSIVGTLLHKAELRFGLTMIAMTGLAYIIVAYIRIRVHEPKD